MKALRLVSIQVGMPRTMGSEAAHDPMDRPWTTGFFKEVVSGHRRVHSHGIKGDGQADQVHHGGVDKAICVYPSEHYEAWSQELNVALPTGAFGENFTSVGMVESDVCIGDVFACGGLVLQVSQPRQPCWKLARRWRIKDLAARVESTGLTGWYFRVLAEGQVCAGDCLERMENPNPRWSIAEANAVMHHRKSDLHAARALAQCAGLSASWNASLMHRVQNFPESSRAARLQDPSSS